MGKVSIYLVILYLKSTCPEPPDSKSLPTFVYNWEFFLNAGVELERNDFPDLALRSLRTSLLLLGENATIDPKESSRVEHEIKEWVQQTKARRLGAFKAISGMIKIGSQAQLIEWKVGYDIRQVCRNADSQRAMGDAADTIFRNNVLCIILAVLRLLGAARSTNKAANHP